MKVSVLFLSLIAIGLGAFVNAIPIPTTPGLVASNPDISGRDEAGATFEVEDLAARAKGSKSKETSERVRIANLRLPEFVREVYNLQGDVDQIKEAIQALKEKVQEGTLDYHVAKGGRRRYLKGLLEGWKLEITTKQKEKRRLDEIIKGKKKSINKNQVIVNSQRLQPQPDVAHPIDNEVSEGSITNPPLPDGNWVNALLDPDRRPVAHEDPENLTTSRSG